LGCSFTEGEQLKVSAQDVEPAWFKEGEMFGSGRTPMGSKQDQTQRAGDHSTQIQAGGNVTIGVTVQEVRDIAELVFEKNAPVMKEQARAEARENCQLFFKVLAEQVGKNLELEEMKRFATADMQYALAHASIQASRKRDDDKCRLLASLLVHKAKTKDDVRDLMITQAIEVAPKLTFNQLNLLAFVYLSRHNRPPFSDFEAVAQYVQKVTTDFQTLTVGEGAVGSVVALGCAVYETATQCFEERLAESCEQLLPVQPTGIRGMRQYPPEGLTQLRKALGLNEQQIATLDGFNSSAAHILFLTPVGKAIALSHMEQLGMVGFDWKPLLDW
jgi:hypothetical protein